MFNNNNSVLFQPPSPNFNPENVSVPIVPNISTPGIGNDLFGSKAAIAVSEPKTKTQQEVDDFLYELPDNGMPDLMLEMV